MLAVVFAGAMAIWSLFSPAKAAAVFLAGQYLGFFCVQALQIATRPKSAPFHLTAAELDVFRRHFTFLMFPAAAMDQGWGLNTIRVAGLAGIPWMLWHSLWVHALLLVIFFFLVGHLCVALQPQRYVATAAAKGNAFAAEQLALLRVVGQRYEYWRSDSRRGERQ